MRNIGIIGLVAFLSLVTACSNGQTNSDSKKKNKIETVAHVIPEFDIQFPVTEFKVEKTESRDPNLENILITNWILQGAKQNKPFMYFIAHNAFPNKLKVLEKTDPNLLNESFKAMLAGSATKLGGTDFEFKQITYKNYIGMESICKVFNGDGIIKSRVYKIDNDLFMISAGGQQIDIESVDKFLNSFGLKK
ncbi:hypothetical protein [Labilibaculum sp.]|uniref:hypothetical protein n=1 Tax=Labilibaculum sp. TaxID=2060723 RepID=UPI002AA7564F|nr:hypothetical protein [Labilibaculum sp.]